MSKIRVCDICGGTENDHYRDIIITHYKMKKERNYGWERIDICSDCEREIRLKVKNGGKENGK